MDDKGLTSATKHSTDSQLGFVRTLLVRNANNVLQFVLKSILSSCIVGIYQQDNAQPRAARLSQQSYNALPWLVRLPDLSLKEIAWGTLER